MQVDYPLNTIRLFISTLYMGISINTLEPVNPILVLRATFSFSFSDHLVQAGLF